MWMWTVPVGRIQKPSRVSCTVSIVFFKEHQVYHTCKSFQLFCREKSPAICFKATIELLYIYCVYILGHIMQIYNNIHTYIQLHYINTHSFMREPQKPKWVAQRCFPTLQHQFWEPWGNAQVVQPLQNLVGTASRGRRWSGRLVGALREMKTLHKKNIQDANRMNVPEVVCEY